MLLFVYFSFFCQSVALALWLNGLNNLWILHFNVPLAFALLGFFYMKIWKRYVHQFLIPSIIVFFLVFSLVNSLFFQDIYSFNSNALTVQSMLLVILSLASFGLLIRETSQKYMPITSSLSWMNSGIFIYYASSIVLFFFGDIIMTRSFPKSAGRMAWIPHSVFSTIMYICFLFGLWKSPKQ